MKDNLRTDPEIMRLSIPLSQSEMEKLESSLIEQGCCEPITIWNGFILDGHKRYKMCINEGIDFDVHEMEFNDLNEAAIWICSQRINQFDKYSVQYCYLVGKMYSYLKVMFSEQRKEDGYHRENTNRYEEYTCVRLGNKIGLGRTSILKYRRISEAMDIIDNTEPMLFQSIMSGDLIFKSTEILKMGRMDNKQLGTIRRKLVEQNDVKMRSHYSRNKKRKATHIATENVVSLRTGIKEMPEFDPDMSLKGLTLTIPMWISAIERARQQTDMSIASENAKMQLGEMLIKLDDIIQNALEVL